jgi:two-component system chemotaxis response regulator CheB
MGPVLAELVRELVEVDTAPAPQPLLAPEIGTEIDTEIGTGIGIPENPTENPARASGEGSLGTVSGFTCPDCHGALLEFSPSEGRFRCRVGHAWSADALLAAHGESLERALWTAVRTLDEKVALATRLYEQNVRHGNDLIATRYERLMREAAEAAEVLRKHLTSVPVMNATDAGP